MTDCSAQSLEQFVLGDGRLQNLLDVLAVDAVVDDLVGLTRASLPSEIDWKFALLAASALTRAKSVEGRSAALRIVHSGLEKEPMSEIANTCALLLARIGNARAVDRAVRKELVEGNSLAAAPQLAVLDVISRRLELTVEVDGKRIQVNEFQRDFWDAAAETDWLSVSAPTSAGKSYILKRWIAKKASERDAFRALYIVPTRALVEEISADFSEYFGSSLRVQTMPWQNALEAEEMSGEILVLTQERAHLLLRNRGDFSPHLIVLDEAQKMDDGGRGVLLQQVLDELVERSPESQVIFASPLTSNPEVLLEGIPKARTAAPLVSEVVTVNQNLLHVIRLEGRCGRLRLLRNHEEIEIGSFSLPARPQTNRKRLAFVAASLGGNRTGNVVYANGAADAEAIALLIADCLQNPIDSEEIKSLIELSASAIHSAFPLARVLKAGVAFHYGNMPQVVRAEIERLFKAGLIKYLVCTSTLLEGVNLPCRNIFVRGPEKGKNSPMTPGDFWNLAGRAGRWGQEFQGNIICVDTDREGVWQEVPISRRKQVISRAIDPVLQDPARLIEYAGSSSMQQREQGPGTLEAVLSLTASKLARSGRLEDIVGFGIEDAHARELGEVLVRELSSLGFDSELISRHPGVSPKLMDSLYEAICAEANPSSLVLPPPESEDSRERYFNALRLIGGHLNVRWGTDLRKRQMAGLIVNWMSGKPLPVIISGRLKWNKGNAKKPRPDVTVIREVLSDVEKIARFEAPKYLSCYQDLVQHAAAARGEPVDPDDVLDIGLMLELGVSRETDASLMSIGLSRTSAIAIGELIVSDTLTPAEVFVWLQDQDLESLDLPRLVVSEARRAVS